jgi:hypothetical protein
MMEFYMITSPHTIARRAHKLALAQAPAPADAPEVHPVFNEYYAPIWGVMECYGSHSFSRLVSLKVARVGNQTCAEAHEALAAMRCKRPDVRASDAFWDAYMS